MRSGRELDALVAEKVMGQTPEWREKMRGHCMCGRCETCSICSWPLPYSTNIAAAWEVVEHWSKRTRYLFFLVQIAPTQLTKGAYRAGWGYTEDFSKEDTAAGAEAIAPTAPHAICLAALKAAGAIS